MKTNLISIGVFTDHKQASQALMALEQAGFDKNKLGYVSPREEDLSGVLTDATPSPISIAAGAVGGGVIGGLLGIGTMLLILGVGPALASGLFVSGIWGVALGAVAGGLMGAFLSVSVPKEEARFYHSELEKGHTLVTVRGGKQTRDAIRFLREHGALDVEMCLGRPALHAGPSCSIPPLT